MNNNALVLDLLEWVALKPRSYDETMRAWRTSCPRLPIWEDAVDLGLVARTPRPGCAPAVEVTEAGRELLVRESRAASARHL